MEAEKEAAAKAAAATQEKEASETQASQEPPASDDAAKDVVKEATAEAEKAAAVDAGDKAGEEAADAALTAVEKDEGEKAGEKTEQEETEDERLEREIAEMEAKEREEEERERAYQEKRQKEKAAAAEKEAELQAKRDEDLRRQEREAEEREEQKERERAAERVAADKGDEDTDDQSRDLFAQLKKPNLGPGASTPGSGTETPASEEAEPSPMPPPAQPSSGSLARPAGISTAGKPKPAHLKLETTKRVEPAEPTPGMQALKSARFLALKEEAKYPDGFKSPNPALNVNGTRKGKAYDKDFLLQFQNVFKEKPSVDWDQKVRETLGPGDEPGSARPGSARTPSSNMGRSASGRPPQPMQNFGGAMGQFGGIPNRTLPPGTTSAQRFEASQQGGGRPGMGAMPGQMGGRMPNQFGGMPPPVGMSRTNSLQTMGNLGGPGSPRQPSGRGGKGGSRRGDRVMSKKEEAELASKMPLTAHMEIKGLEKSTTGWKPTSIGGPIQAEHDLSGNLSPELVQRKVKAALNKMTPDNFDKISNQILEIAAQSKNETDGRTLRQVIQLTFEKACDEAHWAEMYARFCHKMLTAMSTEIRDETIKDKNGDPVVGGALFRKYLLNRCQEEFERGWEVNLPALPDSESGDVKLLSDEYYIAAAAKRKGLGLIQFIGQLYILRMLTLRIMHQCVMKLLNFEGEPDEAAVENLTTLLRSVGGTMEEESDTGAGFIAAYFERIESAILKSDALPSRPKFMVMDLIDLRKAGWKGKNDNKGPKTIQQIHQEAEAAAARAEAERQRTAQRGGPGGGRPPAGRGDARQFSSGAPPVDYNRNTVGLDDLRRLQARGQANRATGSGLGPGGSLGPGSMLGARSGSRRGAGNLGPASSGNTTRTNTPPVGDKKDEAPSQNAFK
jgi:translation initiation factor 4G